MSTNPPSSTNLAETYYSILGIPSDSTLATIRNAYTTLILTCHPDKVDNSINTSSSSSITNTKEVSIPSENTTTNTASSHDKFLKVQTAWEVLRDTERRRQYDEELLRLNIQLQQQYQIPISDDIPFTDFTKKIIKNNESSVQFSYPCRCGDLFILTKEEKEQNITLLDCNTCSLRIRILYNE